MKTQCRERRHLPETLGPGCAFLDYDNDGWMDILFVNSGPCDFFKPKKRLNHALYKNNRDGTFTDVTERAGLTAELFAMGVVVGDYDNDGLPDILITAYGRPVLYHNNGDGTFTDVTAKSKLDAPGGRPAAYGSTMMATVVWTFSSAASSNIARQYHLRR